MTVFSAKKSLALAGAAGLAVIAAGCSAPPPSASEVKQAGFKPLATAEQTFTCFDYSGNAIFKENSKSASAGTTRTINEGPMGESITNAGCIRETLSIEPGEIADAESKAPYKVVVTNGTDKILLSGRFSDFSRYDNGTEFVLTRNGVELRKIELNNGVQFIATKNTDAISQDLQAPKVPAP